MTDCSFHPLCKHSDTTIALFDGQNLFPNFLDLWGMTEKALKEFDGAGVWCGVVCSPT